VAGFGDPTAQLVDRSELDPGQESGERPGGWADRIYGHS
jgi:hypothetical protein